MKWEKKERQEVPTTRTTPIHEHHDNHPCFPPFYLVNLSLLIFCVRSFSGIIVSRYIHLSI